MPWEIFERVVRRSTSPTITISKLGRLNFNGAATAILHSNAVESVLLMWDKDARRIGVRRVGKKDGRAYSVHYARKNSFSGFAAKTFLNHIDYDYSETKSYPCEWNEEESMFAFSLASHPRNQEQQEPQVARTEHSGGRRRWESSAKSKASATL